MKRSALSILFGLFAHSVVSKPAANPQITPAPLVKRGQGQALIGYYSQVVGTSTTWLATNCPRGSTVSTSGNFWQCCDQSSAVCPFATACLGTSVVGPGSTGDCNVIQDYYETGTIFSSLSDAFCSSDLLYASLGATSAQEYFWCGVPGLYGTDNYLATTSGTPSISTPIPPPPPRPTSTSKSTPIGAIVGGVIGGLAVIGAITAAIFFCCIRKRNNKTVAQQTAPLGGLQQAQYHNAESEAMSPQSQSSGWASHDPRHNSMYKDPMARMSPPQMSASPYPAPMYMPPEMHQVPVNQMPMQQAPMHHMPMQPSYHQPNSGALELESHN